MAQIFAGLFTEGDTDFRFLQPIIQRTLEAVAFDCSGQFDIEVMKVKIDKSELGFTEQVLSASQKGFEEMGIHILCVHSDADNTSSTNTYKDRITPAELALALKEDNNFCKILVAVIPIHEIEAWMLADKELLKNEIGTDKSDYELGIHKAPEISANPKEDVVNAIRIAREGLTKEKEMN